MKKIFTILTSAVVFVFIFSTLSAADYSVIVDAGSTGSRIYLYQNTKDSNGFPEALQVKLSNNKVTPGIANYAGSPQNVGAYITPLLQSVETKLNDIGVNQKDVDFYLLATAGMRVIAPSQQTALYDELINYVKTNTEFNVKDVSTISGKYEGVFNWIAVNSLRNTLTSGDVDANLGILDLGGASLEIAFATSKPIFNKNDKVNFNYGQTKYILYSHSYLGLGQDMARYQFSDDPSCFLKNYPLPNGLSGTGNYHVAIRNVSRLVRNHQIGRSSTQLPNLSHFVALSGFVYIMQPLELSPYFSINDLKKATMSYSQKTWSQVQEENPDNPYLYSYYFNSILIINLLKTMGFNHHSKLEAASDIDGKDISWTQGAAIFFIAGNQLESKTFAEIAAA
ncbi:MAG: hypothetical protein GY750_08370 [Lentisphaerae bacterium]|nr:hypothetical protein [Lentisphaerota bacterium]MCP4101424.1 hypothetical protein [Lentisphaerota bacterium]